MLHCWTLLFLQFGISWLRYLSQVGKHKFNNKEHIILDIHFVFLFYNNPKSIWVVFDVPHLLKRHRTENRHHRNPTTKGSNNASSLSSVRVSYAFCSNSILSLWDVLSQPYFGCVRLIIAGSKRQKSEKYSCRYNLQFFPLLYRRLIWKY